MIRSANEPAARIVQLARQAMPTHTDRMTIPPAIEVDARGHRCPTPTLRLRRALEAVPAGALVRLLADDPLARVDVPHFVAATGAELVTCAETPGGGLAFLIRKPTAAPAQAPC